MTAGCHRPSCALPVSPVPAFLPCYRCCWLPCSTLIIGSNSGAKLDRAPERTRKPLDKRERRVVLAVITNAAGQVVDTRIIQSSGSGAVDDYVRAYPPTEATPSSVTTLELVYSSADGFTKPKVLKIEPIAGQ